MNEQKPREDIIQRIDKDVTAHVSFMNFIGKDQLYSLRLYQSSTTHNGVFIPPTDMQFLIRKVDDAHVNFKRLIERILPYLEDTDD